MVALSGRSLEFENLAHERRSFSGVFRGSEGLLMTDEARERSKVSVDDGARHASACAAAQPAGAKTKKSVKPPPPFSRAAKKAAWRLVASV